MEVWPTLLSAIDQFEQSFMFVRAVHSRLRQWLRFARRKGKFTPKPADTYLPLWVIDRSEAKRREARGGSLNPS